MGFSWAVSGMMMPALVLVSAVIGFTSSRSCKGLNFMVFPSVWTGPPYRYPGRPVSTRQPPLELGGGCRIQGHRQPGDLAIVMTAPDLAMAIEPGDGGAVAQRHRNLAGLAAAEE